MRRFDVFGRRVGITRESARPDHPEVIELPSSRPG